MRFADVRDLVFRGGHLSDRALVDVCMTGERPAHLDRCDICAARAIDVGRWLDEVRTVAEADLDAAFPAERLAAQQAQIMRRLEQLDQPARVIAFPRHLKLEGQSVPGHRVAPGWVAVAAAAGLVLGVIGGQVSARLTGGAPASAAGIQMAANVTTAGVDAEHVNAINQADQDIADGKWLHETAIDAATPRPFEQPGAVIPAAYSGGSRDK